jgi:hypothetical protein
MKKSLVYIIVAVVIIIIIIAGVAAFLLMNNNGGTTNPTTTPTPTPPPSVASATSLKFNVQENPGTANALNYTYSVNNFNMSNEILRVDIPASSYSLVINLADSSARSSTNGGATWTTDDFATDATFATLLNDYATTLEASWTGQATVSYNDSVGNTGTLSDIQVNPTIPASTFTTS